MARLIFAALVIENPYYPVRSFEGYGQLADDSGFIIELRHIGSYVKVSAIDPETMTEVSIVGSPKLSKKQLSNLAIKKLLYVMNRDKKKAKTPPNNYYDEV